MSGRPPVPAASKKMILRLRTGSNSETTNLELEDTTEIGLLKFMIEATVAIPLSQLKVFGGYPLQSLDVLDETQPLSAVFRNNDLLIVQKNEGKPSIIQGTTDGKYVPPAHEKGIFVRRTVPGDNSCLFHACSYVLENKSRTGGPGLRQKCAEVVLANPQKFTSAILGRRTEDYANWIMLPTSWGGYVELMILSFLFQTELVAIDCESQTLQRVGDNENYQTRGFLVYTGQHYDAMAIADPIRVAFESSDQVLFNPRDERILRFAIDFVKSGCK